MAHLKFSLLALSVLALLVLGIACATTTSPSSPTPAPTEAPTPAPSLPASPSPTPTAPEATTSPTAAPTPPLFLEPAQVLIAPGVGLDPTGVLFTRDGHVQLQGNGTANYCYYPPYFLTEEARKRLEAVLADEEAMSRIRAYLEQWGLADKPVRLPAAIWMEDVPEEVQEGAEAVLQVSISTKRDCPLEYPVEIPIGSPAFDFVVTQADGTEVWRWSQGQVAGEPTTLRLKSSEDKKTFQVTWDLHDQKGLPLPEGAYWVEGYLNIGLVEGAPPKPELVDRHLLFVGGRPPISRWLDIWLEVPKTAKTGERVPLVLKVRNRTNQPIQLAHGVVPFDFLVFREDGTEVWRWSRSLGAIPAALRGTILQPGQTLEYRDPPYTSSAWDQYDQDCTLAPSTGLPCRRGKPVLPGKYLVHGTFEAALSSKDYARYEETLQVGPQELLIEP